METTMHYRHFGRGTGLRVAELVLGTGMFGTRWGGYGAEPDESRRILDGYLDAGGNFVDTADSYQVGQSEELLGQFITGNLRDDLVLATKYTLGGDAENGLQRVGNSRKNMVRSVEASLRRLQTDRLDLYWVHLADGVTASEEILRGLDDLVRAGKILYIGLSDFPAWRVAHAATLAELRGWAPVIGLQMEYSLVERTPERELIPMAEAFGMGMVGWSPLAGGLLSGKYRRGETGRAETFKRLVHVEDDARKAAIVDTLLAVAAEQGATPGQVALAWMGGRGVLPIVGPRTRAQLDDSLGAVGIVLTDQQRARLDASSAIALGFPHDLLAADAQRTRLAGGVPAQIAALSYPVK
jgi:aryl-alcohol dehydrogenase-like predicted oxidoreductase